jgi:hypothetical protein
MVGGASCVCSTDETMRLRLIFLACYRSWARSILRPVRLACTFTLDIVLRWSACCYDNCILIPRIPAFAS